jgi:acyl carrier protein
MNLALNEIKATVREVFLADLGIEIEQDEQNFFLELGVDSLAYLNVIARLEKLYAIKFANEALPDFQTCNLLAGAIQTQADLTRKVA